MSSVWQQTTFAPGHDTSVTIQHESLPWVCSGLQTKPLRLTVLAASSPHYLTIRKTAVLGLTEQ